MTKKQLYIALLIIVALSITAPWIWTDDIKEGLTLATTILSGLCALVTFYIAILLYDRYGVESTAHQKSIEAIDELLAEMQKIHFILGYFPKTEQGEPPHDYIIGLSLRSNKELVIRNISPEDLSSPLYYKQSGMFACVHLVEKAENLIYLPHSVFEAANQLSVFEYSNSDLTRDSRPMMILSANSDRLNADNETLDGISTHIPKTNYSVIQFIDYYFGIRDSIVKWYKDNNVNLDHLNIEYK